MNPDLCKVQQTLVSRFMLSDRIQVIEGELSTRPDLLVCIQSMGTLYCVESRKCDGFKIVGIG